MTLSLVIPCYNESRRLQIRAYLSCLEQMPNLSFCFVDDGSTDSTPETLAFLSRESPNIGALYLKSNRGKAEAVRAGIRYLCDNSGADAFGFWDADLATPLEEIPAFLSRLEKDPACSAVVGARWPHLGAHIHRGTFRGILGRVMKSLIRHYLGEPVYDTQCGAKIFRRKLAGEIFKEPFATRWLFDVELFKRMGHSRLRHGVFEQPLSVWRDVPGSKLGAADGGRILLEFIRILRRYPG